MDVISQAALGYKLNSSGTSGDEGRGCGGGEVEARRRVDGRCQVVRRPVGARQHLAALTRGT